MYYYLVAHPKTVVSIVKYGKLPTDLPDWAKVTHLFCASSIKNCFPENITTPDQNFVLKLDIPDQENTQKAFLFLEEVNPSYIKESFVYSQRGLNLLNNLFRKNCPIAVSIQPDIYPNMNEVSKKRPRDEIKEANNSNPINKKQATTSLSAQTNQLPIPKPVLTFSHTLPKTQMLNKEKVVETKPTFFYPTPTTINPQATTSILPSKERQAPIHMIDRVSTYAEHIALLKEAFEKAQQNILVTSFSITHETLLNCNLYNLIPAAVKRGVKIYIYYNDSKNLSPKIESFFHDYHIFPQESYTHSKILAVDNNFLVTGSYNWLSTLNSKYEESDEGSFVFRGDICAELKEDFWTFIKYYRNLQFGNERALQEFEDDSENEETIIYDINDTTELAYLPSLEEQCGFFEECFKMAKKRLIICSPFISSSGAYKEDINHHLLRDTTNRGVDIYFICAPESVALKSFSDFLAQVNSPKLHLITMANIHLKTIIVDENIIAEGSFNWLSATRNGESDYHNHEQTMYVQGSMAKKLIEKFYASRVGLSLQKQMPKPAKEIHHFPFFARGKQPIPTLYQKPVNVTETEKEDSNLQKAIRASLSQVNS